MATKHLQLGGKLHLNGWVGLCLQSIHNPPSCVGLGVELHKRERWGRGKERTHLQASNTYIAYSQASPAPEGKRGTPQPTAFPAMLCSFGSITLLGEPCTIAIHMLPSFLLQMPYRICRWMSSPLRPTAISRLSPFNASSGGKGGCHFSVGIRTNSPTRRNDREHLSIFQEPPEPCFKARGCQYFGPFLSAVVACFGNILLIITCILARSSGPGVPSGSVSGSTDVEHFKGICKFSINAYWPQATKSLKNTLMDLM